MGRGSKRQRSRKRRSSNHRARFNALDGNIRKRRVGQGHGRRDRRKNRIRQNSQTGERNKGSFDPVSKRSQKNSRVGGVSRRAGYFSAFRNGNRPRIRIQRDVFDRSGRRS